MVVTAGEVEHSFMQGDVAGAKRKLRQLIQQGSIPRFLRAVEVVKGSKKKVYHFVEWHSGDAKQLIAPTSFTQLCVYRDLGEVCTYCEIQFLGFVWRGHRLERILGKLQSLFNELETGGEFRCQPL